MNSQDFLTLNLIGAGAFLVWYLLSRGGSQAPTKLNMKAKDTAPTVLEPLEDSNAVPVASEERQVEVVSAYPKPRQRTVSSTGPKVLNVMFNYNGHSWDAYEVLGVPAGSSLPIVTEAYQNALKKCDKESMEFLETAYHSILRKQ